MQLVPGKARRGEPSREVYNLVAREARVYHTMKKFSQKKFRIRVDMALIETNGETDHLQHNLFVDISYKFTLAWGFVSYACTRITMNTCLTGKKLVLFTWIQFFKVNAHTYNNHKS